jgi:crossover junction endodeoxyribonuclease RuvC
MAIILGIDPGLASTGFGVIAQERGRLRCVEFGVISTPADASPGERLLAIHHGVAEQIARHAPQRAGVESLYFTRNTSSAIPVAQARGVVLLALAQAAVHASEYTPQVIKQAVVGNGNADKEQVMQMVRIILGMDTTPQPDHAADALAAAITSAHMKDSPHV